MISLAFPPSSERGVVYYKKMMGKGEQSVMYDSNNQFDFVNSLRDLWL